MKQFNWKWSVDGNWGKGADWGRSVPDSATANATLSTAASYEVAINNGASFVANSLRRVVSWTSWGDLFSIDFSHKKEMPMPDLDETLQRVTPVVSSGPVQIPKPDPTAFFPVDYFQLHHINGDKIITAHKASVAISGYSDAIGRTAPSTPTAHTSWWGREKYYGMLFASCQKINAASSIGTISGRSAPCQLLAVLASLVCILFFPASALAADPQFGNAYYNGGGVILAPYNISAEYDNYNIRWEPGTALDAKAHQDSQPWGGIWTGTYRLFASQPGPYTLIVQGCSYSPVLIGPSHCTNWSKPVTVTIPSGAVIKSTTYTFPNDSKGDCRMQNTKMVLTSDGVLSYASQVMTTHTSSGDYWHADITLLDNTGKSLLFFNTITSMKLEQGHSWYTWTWSTRYDGTLLPQIAKIHMNNSC